jgi:hypothetical protein
MITSLRSPFERRRGANYFVELKDVTTGFDAMTFYLKGGSPTTDFKVPQGEFILKYATGTSWCSEAEFFGPETSFNQADETFEFRRDHGWTVELIPQRGGNLRTRRIPRDRF